MKALIFTICFGLLCVLCIGLLCQNFQLRQTGTVYVPSPTELQIIVGAEPDGIIGPDSMAKWELYYGNQSAYVSINPYTMGVD